MSATIAFADVFHALPPLPAAMATIASGWLVTLILAPRRLMLGLTDSMPAIDELSQRVRALADGDRTRPLTELVIQGDDAVSRLSMAIRDLAAETVSTRSQSRLLHRRMDSEIESQTRKATADLERQACTDPLTGLGNRRELDAQIERMLASRVGSKRQITVMAIDLDHFKQVNDAMGHDVGDQCLVFLGDLLKSCLRREDCAIRLGGDEFVVLLPDQDMNDADAVARRLRTLYGMMPWTSRRPARPTLSIGSACEWITTAQQAADLMRQADTALYAAKQARRSATRPSAA